MASKEDVAKLRKEVAQVATQLGAVYEATTVGYTEGHEATVLRAPEDLAAACGLPHGVAERVRVAEALIEQEAAHSFDRLLLQRARAKSSAEQVGLSAALSSWSSLPPPKTAAEWEQLADVLGQVLANLNPSSELHQAVLLLRDISAAAAEAEACGCPDALLRLLCSTPQPGTRAWPPAMSLVQALMGSWSRELELDAPVRLHHGADGCLVIKEAKLTAKGVAKARRQLLHAFRIVAWLHAVLGKPLPRLEGRIVVPARELREVERLLRGARGAVQDTVPGGAGAKFSATIKAVAV